MSEQSIRRPPLRLVISGGIGSGKSTVAARLRELGARVIETDRLGHAVLEPGGAAYEAVARRWPSAVRDGRIDRGALAGIVFEDVAELRRLEAVTHPAIAAEISRLVDQAGSAIVAVEVPVAVDLVGPGWITVVVEAPEELRVARAMGGGWDEADVRRRMAAQPDREEWRARADYVLVNDGTRADLMRAVDDLWVKLQTGAGRGREPGTD